MPRMSNATIAGVAVAAVVVMPFIVYATVGIDQAKK